MSTHNVFDNNQCPCGPTNDPIVDKLLGNAYLVVKYVAMNMPAIKVVSDEIASILAVYAKLKELSDIQAKIPELMEVRAALPHLEVLHTNLVQLLTLYTHIDELVKVATSIDDINVITPHLQELVTVAANITEVAATGTNITKVIAVANSITSVNKLAPVITEIDTLAQNIQALVNINASLPELLNIDHHLQDLLNIETPLSKLVINSFEALRRTYAEAGLILVTGSFEDGAKVTTKQDVVLERKTGKGYNWQGSIPSDGKIIPAGSTPTSTGGVGIDKWQDLSNITYASQRELTGGKQYTLFRAFESAVTLTQVNEAVQFSVGGIFYRWDGVFPQGGLVIPQNTPDPSPDQTGAGKYVAVLDLEMRSLLGKQSREALRRSYADAGYNLVDGSFEAGGTLVNANDVLLQERTGKAFSGPVGAVAAGTNPAIGGFVDRSGYLLKAQLGAVSILEFDKDADLGYPHDAHPAWLKAKATGKQVIFPKPRNRYYMQGPMILEQTSILGSGVGQAYGNTAVVVEFGGFTADYAVESKTKMNRFEGFYFTPRSWDPVSGFVGAGLKQAAMTVGIDSAFVGFKDGGHRISVPSSDTTTETWLSRYVRCSFEFNGKHGAHYKDAGNGVSFIDCNGRWNGSPSFMVQPTVQSVWDGISIESDKPTGSLSRPEGLYLSGGDWSYNSRYGFDVQSGHGGVMNPGYIELNLKNGGRVGGTAKGWKVRPRHIGQSIERNIESLFQTPLGGTIAKMPNEIDAGGVPLGTGGLYGDDATTIPSLELASDGAMHKILTYNWSGVWGSILRLMTKTGDMVYRAASADGRIMKLYLDKVQIEDQQVNDKTHKLVARVAREVSGLPAASAEYQNTMLFNVVDRKLYFCFYNSTAFEWKQVSLV